LTLVILCRYNKKEGKKTPSPETKREKQSDLAEWCFSLNYPIQGGYFEFITKFVVMQGDLRSS
jgi:hypothetical protein